MFENFLVLAAKITIDNVHITTNVFRFFMSNGDTFKGGR